MDHDQGMNYSTMMSHNHEDDTSILRRRTATQTILDGLMEDEVLARLHGDAVNWHQSKIVELKKRPDFATLFNDIVGQIAERDSARVAS